MNCRIFPYTYQEPGRELKNEEMRKCWNVQRVEEFEKVYEWRWCCIEHQQVEEHAQNKIAKSTRIKNKTWWKVKMWSALTHINGCPMFSIPLLKDSRCPTTVVADWLYKLHYWSTVECRVCVLPSTTSTGTLTQSLILRVLLPHRATQNTVISILANVEFVF